MAIIICTENIDLGLNFITQHQSATKVFTMEKGSEKITTKEEKIQINEAFKDQKKYQFIVIGTSLFKECQLSDIRKPLYQLFEQENYQFLECLILIDIVDCKEITHKISLALQIQLNQWVQLQYNSQLKEFYTHLPNLDIIPFKQSTSKFGQFEKITLKENIAMYIEQKKREIVKNVKIYLLIGPSKVGKSTLVNQICGIKNPFSLKNEYYNSKIQGHEYIFIDTIGYEREWEQDLAQFKEIYSYTLQIVDNFKAKLDGILIFESISNDSLNIIYTFKLLQQCFNATTLANSCMIIGTKGNIIPANFQSSRIESLHSQSLKLFGKDIPLINCQLSHYSFGEFVNIPKQEETKQEFLNSLTLLVPAMIQQKEKKLFILCGNNQIGKTFFINYLANRNIICLFQNQIGTLYRLITNQLDNYKDYYFIETTGNFSKSTNAKFWKKSTLAQFIFQVMQFLDMDQIDGFLFMDSITVPKISVIEIMTQFQEKIFKDVKNCAQHLITIALTNFEKKSGNLGKFDFLKQYVSKKLPTMAINIIMFEYDEKSLNQLNEQLTQLVPLPKSVIQNIVDSELDTIEIGKQICVIQQNPIEKKQDKSLDDLQCIIEYEMNALDDTLYNMVQNYVLQLNNNELYNDINNIQNESKDLKALPLKTKIYITDALGEFKYDHFCGLISLKLQLLSGEPFPAQFRIQQNKIKSFKTVEKELQFIMNLEILEKSILENQNQFNFKKQQEFILRYLNWSLNFQREQLKKQMIIYNIMPGNEKDCDQQIKDQIANQKLVQISNPIQAKKLKNDQLKALGQRAKYIYYLECYVIIEDLDDINDQQVIAVLQNIPNLFVFFTTHNLDKVQKQFLSTVDQLVNVVNPNFQQRAQIIENYKFTQKINDYLQLLSYNFSSNSLNKLLNQLKSIYTPKIELQEICQLAKQICKKDGIRQLQNMSYIADQLILGKQSAFLPFQYFYQKNITEVFVSINNDKDRKINSVIFYENDNVDISQTEDCRNQSKLSKKEDKCEAKLNQILQNQNSLILDESPYNYCIPNLFNIQCSNLEDLQNQFSNPNNNQNMIEIEIQKDKLSVQLHDELIDNEYNQPYSKLLLNKIQKKYQNIINQNKSKLSIQPHDELIDTKNNQLESAIQMRRCQSDEYQNQKFLKIILIYDQYMRIHNYYQQFDRQMFVNKKTNILEYHIKGKLLKIPLNFDGLPLLALVRIAVKLNIDQILPIETNEDNIKLMANFENYPKSLVIVMLDCFKAKYIDQLIDEIQYATRIYSEFRVAYVSKNQTNLDYVMRVLDRPNQ